MFILKLTYELCEWLQIDYCWILFYFFAVAQWLLINGQTSCQKKMWVNEILMS